MICHICKEEVSEKDFNKHPYRVHQLTLEQYFLQHEPKFDLQTGEKIKYKNPTQYLNTDFNSKTNLRLWLKDQTPEKAKEYCKDLLIKRKIEKNLIYSPSQTELRSLSNMPSIISYDKIFEDSGGYYNLCDQLGFKNKFRKLDILDDFREFDKEKVLRIDTRENKMIKFNDCNVEIATLSYGDYHISGSKIYIDRKSLVDFLGTFGTGLERFKREIKRAKDNGDYLFVLVENDLTKCLGFEYLPYIKRNTKVTSDYIYHNVRNLMQEFDNLQFLFCNGREEMNRLIKKTLQNWEICIKIDNELYYEKKEL